MKCLHVSMVWNKDGQNWVCELCGKGLTEKEGGV